MKRSWPVSTTNLRRIIAAVKTTWKLGWLWSVLMLAFFNVSCDVLSPLENLCNCRPFLPDVSDYRHMAKHVPIPSGTPMDITVDTILFLAANPSFATDTIARQS